MDWNYIKYFKRQEFLCKCCGKENMEFDFLNMLDRLRETVGKRLVVTSGWRCAEHNKEVGGKYNSAHLLGLAADIRVVDSNLRFLVLDYAMALGFNRFGVGQTYIHLDIGDEHTGHPANMLWTYST